MTRTALLVCLAFYSLWANALDREAFTFTNYNLQVTIDSAKPLLSVNGKVILRNDSSTAQRIVFLQISSTLDWKFVTVAGKPVQYLTQSYTSDIDHTGMLSEAVVTLPQPLPPKATVELDIAYEGAVPQDATRLERIGTPKEIAAANDWDRISASFTGLRGIGYVVWYPVALEPASLSEPSEFSEALGRWKQRQMGSSLAARFSVAPDPSNGALTLVTNGVCGTNASETNRNSAATSSCEWRSLGADPPVIVAANYQHLERPPARVYYLAGSEQAASDYANVAIGAAPLVREWLGEFRRNITIVEVPVQGVPFEAGTLYLTPLRTVDTKTLEVFLTHQLAHACLISRRAWISEGVANFMETLQRERQSGRSAAILHMQKQQPALIEIEKNNLKAAKDIPSKELGPSKAATSLISAADPFLASSKGMYVWWMLRDMLGERVLQNALEKYRSQDDKEPTYMQRLLEAEARIVIPQEVGRLEQFFDDWVYRDRGLPDFRIDSVYPRQMLGSGYLLTVTVENQGAAGAEVPVIARARDESPNRRLWVPARQKATIRIPLRAQPTEAQVNDGSVPEMQMTNNTFEIKLESSAQP